VLILHFAFCILNFASAYAQTPGARVVEVVVEQEGSRITDPVLAGLLETSIGEPLRMSEVRETIAHLMSLGRYEDVQVLQESAGDGVRLRYVLVPLHPVDRLEYRGNLGVDIAELRRVIAERFGGGAAQARVEELQRQLELFYRDRGYVQAKITPAIERTHAPDRASLVFDIEAGRRSTITSLDVDNVDVAERAMLLAETRIAIGEPYDASAIGRSLDRYQSALRARGYYQARAVHFASFDPAGGARVAITLDRGPRVTVAFAGDPIPEDDRTRLVPIESEASVEEDLLEDSSRAIEEYLKARGYRDAVVTYTREEQDGELTLRFAVSRGARHVTERVQVNGNMALPTLELRGALAIEEGEPFVQQAVDTALARIRTAYRTRGFARVDVRGTAAVLPPEGAAGGDRGVELSININEGPRTRVGSIVIDGEMVVGEPELRALLTVAPGRPYAEGEVAADRDRIDLEYRNRGYDTVLVQPRITLADGDTRADVTFSITEGPQIHVDHIIVLGNARTSIDTISRELTIKPGDPLGYAALLESQQRLSALGLFRRIQITQVTHPGEPRRDLIVRVEEAPPTTFDYGGGIEGGLRTRPTGDGGQAEERVEFAPRGFFGIGRRNLWGKNRAVNLFARVSLRSRDVVFADSGVRFEDPAAEGGYGFNEYRVFGTFREPRVFNSRADLLLTGSLDQGIRSSFNFVTRAARAEAGVRLSNSFSVAARYSFERTRLFDQKFSEDEAPLIDRLFPQVRLSKVSTSVVRDSRDDSLYPTRGTLSVVDGELALKAIGSEVGFVRTFVQGFAYVPLPTGRRVVVALGARLGAAHGLELASSASAVDGEPVLLPASERFFAGGDTTVRGFSLDRLGDERTITPSGFPTGGNGEIVLQSELRVSILRNRAELVGFLEAGNIYPLASDLDLTALRPAAGFGGRYRSPIGPIRVDVGFNLDRKPLVAGALERAYVLHISLGQAF
jgi:outer membrane protein insertion porin family